MLSASWTRWAVLLTPIAIVATSGCTTLAPGGGLPGIGKGPAPVVNAAKPQTVFVETRPQTGKAKRKELPLAEASRVQEALIAAGAARKFKNSDIKVVRKTADPTAPPIVMGSIYNPKKRQISIETDYALHAGDRVIVQEKSAFDKEGIVGALNRVMAR